MGKLIREFGEYEPKWWKVPLKRNIVASPQFINKANKGLFTKGFESFLNDLQQLMIDNGIGRIYLGADWEVSYDNG